MTHIDSYSAIVVTFRRSASLARVLESIESQTRRPNLVVVADNDPARSGEPVATDPRWAGLSIVYLPLDANSGPAGGWAAAAAAASGRADRGEWVLVLDDDDPIGHPDLVDRLLSTASALPRPERCAAIGLRGATLDRRRALLTRAGDLEGEPVRVDYLASNGAPLYRWSALEDVGFFDEALFFGFEDLDEGIRLTAAGWDLWAVPLPSLHEVADTAPDRLPWREYYKSRALVAIVCRHLGRRALVSTIVQSSLLGALRLAVREGDWRLAEARVAGTIDALRGRMGPNGRAPRANASKQVAAGPGAVLDLIFVSGVSVGGASRSTLELAEELQRRGHQVTVVMGDRPSPGSTPDLLLRAVTKLRPLPGGRMLHRAFRRLCRRGRAQPDAAVPALLAAYPEHAYLSVMARRRPQAVVANSLSRAALATIAEDLSSRSVPFLLYLREQQAVRHVELWGVRPDAVIANSEHLASLARAVGVPCSVVASAVDPGPSATSTTRTTLLVVNPLAENHLDLALAIARARPDIPVVLQESWPLDVDVRSALERQAAELSNVEVRSRVSSPAAVYRDAKLLLALYPSGRPRVIVEAQHNEIPAVALDQPALAEAVGSAGLLVPADASVEAWVAAVSRAWDDERVYEDLRSRCREQAARAPTLPAHVADRFETVVRELLEG